MKFDIPASAASIAQWQSGAVSRRQLLNAGLDSQAIFRRLERGRWQQLHRGVYAVFTGPVPRETELWAALLRAGPGAVLSHLSAAELHGLVDQPSESIFVTVPSARRVAAPGLAIRTCARIGKATQPNREPPRTSVEETVFDLIELAETLDNACGWITRAVGRRLTTAERLTETLARRKKMRWRVRLADMLKAAGDGIHSVLEYHYLRDVERAHGLPRSLHQVRVRIDGKLAYRDAYYKDYRLAVELDGRLAHPDEERWRDRRRDNYSGVEGVQTTRYDWRDVSARPCETALLQARILRRRGWTDTPRPCSPRCPVAGFADADADAYADADTDTDTDTKAGTDANAAQPATNRVDFAGSIRPDRISEFSSDRVNRDGWLRVSLNEARRKRDAEPRLLPGTGREPGTMRARG